MVLQKIKDIFQSKQDEHIGMCWIEEVLPVYHDSACTTNKTVYIIAQLVELGIYEGFELSCKTIRKQTPFIDKKIITQNEIPLKFNKNQNVLKDNIVLNNDVEFTKEGYKSGLCIYIEGQGFLGNISSTLKTWIVADKYVFFKTLAKYPSIYVYSHEELKRMCVKFV